MEKQSARCARNDTAVERRGGSLSLCAPRSGPVMRANKQGRRRASSGRTYRPRSVSSLLMRLRAMAGVEWVGA
jgi:hypothetical protein